MNATTALTLLAALLAGCSSPGDGTDVTVESLPRCRSFAVEVSGHGPPLVLIPGLASPGQVWRTTVEHYRSDHRLHVLTLAGFAGRAPSPGRRR
jgi:N-formylmaleamate deformylase